MEDCECNFAENMYVAGLLTCDDATRCPEDCPICNTCLSIIGCNVTDIPDPGLNGKGILGNLSKEELLYIVGAAIAVVLLFLIVLCRSRKSSEKMEDLKKDLMAGESADDGTDCETHASQSYNPAWQPPKEIYSEFKPEGNEGPFDENTKLQDVDLESPQVSNDAPLVVGFSILPTQAARHSEIRRDSFHIIHSPAMLLVVLIPCRLYPDLTSPDMRLLSLW